MIRANISQSLQVLETLNTYPAFPIAIEVQPDRKLNKLLADLSPDTPWGDRRNATKKLGQIRSQEALPGLIEALPNDPFWMVRCEIIQALERLGNPRAIPTLRKTVKNDSFQVVRSYAAKAIERLSQEW